MDEREKECLLVFILCMSVYTVLMTFGLITSNYIAIWGAVLFVIVAIIAGLIFMLDYK